MEKKHRDFKIFVYLILTIILSAVFALAWYSQSLNKKLSGNVCQTMEEVSLQQRFNLAEEMTAEMQLMETLASTLAHYQKDMEELKNLLTSVVEKSNFTTLFVARVDGMGINDLGEKHNFSEQDYFQKAVLGESFIGNPVNMQKVTVATIRLATASIIPFAPDATIPFATAIRNTSGTITGVLIGMYELANLKTLILPSFEQKGMFYLLDSEYNVMVSSNTQLHEYTQIDNFKQFLNEKISHFNYGSVDEFLKDCGVAASGHMNFITHDNTFYCHYNPLSINGWYLVSMVDFHVISDYYTTISRDTAFLTFFLVLCFGMLILFILTQNSKHSKGLEQVAYYDRLTKLPNAEMFKIEANSIMKAHPNESFVCIVLDVKNFKYVNESYGINAGNKVLITIAEVSQQIMKEEPEGTSIVSRLYADTFALFMLSSHASDILPKKERFLKECSERMKFLDDYKLDICMGRYYIRLGDNANAVYEKANIAHTKARQGNPNIIVDFDNSHMDDMKKEGLMLSKLHAALDNEEFEVFLQPKVCLDSGTVCCAEALVRWKRGNQYIAPNDFIPLLERNGMIVRLDMYMFERCCKLLACFKKEGLLNLQISVNFSRNHMADENFCHTLKEITDRHGVCPHDMKIEITETVAMENQGRMKRIADQLHEYGFQISMDDFGSGYSSLGFLDEFMVDEIKIDRSLINNVSTNSRTTFIVKNIIRMAKELGIRVIAEGVETRIQAHTIKELGCDIAQGYLYSKPVRLKEFQETVERINNNPI